MCCPLGFLLALRLSTVSNFGIRKSKTPKQGILYRSVSWIKNEVIEASTRVYKTIGFSTLLHFSYNVVIWASVLTKEKWWRELLKFSNWAFKARNILSKVSPVESDTKKTLYFLFIKLWKNIYNYSLYIFNFKIRKG